MISPILFNLYISDFPVVSELKKSFADDFTIAASDPDLKSIKIKLNADMKSIAKWADRKHLKISSGKSQVILFTPNSREHKGQPKIFYKGELIPVVNSMKILGINLDKGLNLRKQETALADKGSSRLPIVKAVSGPKGGFSMEDRLLTFKAFIPPVFSFGGPVWFPIRSKLKGAVKSLQVLQNSALRAVTGCHNAASSQHVHEEC